METDSVEEAVVRYEKVRNWTVMYKPQVTDDLTTWWVYIFREDGSSADLTVHRDLSAAKRHVEKYWGGKHE